MGYGGWWWPWLRDNKDKLFGCLPEMSCCSRSMHTPKCQSWAGSPRLRGPGACWWSRCLCSGRIQKRAPRTHHFKSGGGVDGTTRVGPLSTRSQIEFQTAWSLLTPPTPPSNDSFIRCVIRPYCGRLYVLKPEHRSDGLQREPAGRPLIPLKTSTFYGLWIVPDPIECKVSVYVAPGSVHMPIWTGFI